MSGVTILCGVDQIADIQERFKYEKVALLTTGAALNRWMIPTLQCVNDRLHLTALFAAEYGLMGERQPGERYESYTDVWTGLPVFSLYRYGTEHLSREMLATFDLLLVDLPMTGSRYCSYVPMIHRLLRELGAAGKKMIILDRPNPLGGTELAGPVLNKSLRESEDDFLLPARYALTTGEVAGLMNGEDQLGCDLEVIRVKNWERALQHPDIARPWIVSQLFYLPRFESGLLSVGLEILRGTNLSVGRGTPMPYEIIGATYLDAIQLSAVLNKKNISGVLFHPIYFTPNVGVLQGCSCQGVQIHVTDRRKIEPVNLALEILNTVRRMAGEDFKFRQNPDGTYPVDHLYGNNHLRRQPGEINRLKEDIEKELKTFEQRCEPYLLY